jgi:DNA-directed RNA polymerase subunit RPC12/RpoP
VEPFSIACTTCQARLRVRDESVIGQILTCPKCGSMVLVEPVAAATDESVDQQPTETDGSEMTQTTTPPADASEVAANKENTASQFNKPNDSPDQTETVEDLSVQAEPTTLAHDTDGAEFEEVGNWRNEPVATESELDASGELSPPARLAEDEALLPNADWTSAATTQWRNRVVTGLAAVVGVILALILFIVFSGDGTMPPTVPETRTTASTEPPKTNASKSNPPQSDYSATEQSVVESEPVTPATITPQPDAPPSKETPAEDSVEAVPDDEPKVTPKLTADPEPVPTPKEDIVSLDEPPGMTPMESDNDGSAATDKLQDDSDNPLSATLRDFGALLNETKEPTPSTATVEAEPTPEPSDLEADPVARRTGPRIVEINDRLNDPIAQIEFDGPLSNFLRFVSDYSTIPITLDADILRFMGISPATTNVKLEVSDSTVAETLNEALAPLALEHRIEVDQLFITRRPRTETGMRTVTFKVGDLAGDDAEKLQQLATWVMDFVDAETWSSRGGVGTITLQGSELVIEQREAVQYKVLELFEKLRVARGLKTRSPYKASMFQLATRGERAASKLVQPIKLTYIRPASLQRIVDRVAELSEMSIIIDWRALAGVDWSPDAEVRFSVADEPTSKALAMLLTPMELAYRIVDESTVQVTTPAALNSLLETEFYRVAKLDDAGAELLQAARDAIGPTEFRDLGGNGRLAFDEVSNCVIASLTQPQQVEFQAWLAARPEATTAVSNRE